MWVDNKQEAIHVYAVSSQALRIQMNHAFKHHYWPPFEKFLKKLKGFKSTKSDNEMALRLVPTWSTSADLSRLILERSSDWPCDWSCNITVMNTYLLSLVGWWETILELMSWLDRIIHNAYQFYSYPPLIFPRKQIMQSRKISCNMTMPHWTMLTVMLDSCDHATATMRLLRTLLESHVD